MRRFICMVFATFIFSRIFAQFSSADSLKKILDKNIAEDSTRVRCLVQYVNALLFTEPDSMMQYADEALRISEKIKWNAGIALCYNAKGVACSYGLNDQVSALDWYHKALEANRDLNNKKLERDVLANIGVIFYNQEQYEDALEYFKKSLNILEQMPEKKGEDQLLLNIANIYFYRNMQDSAALYFHKSLEIAKKNNNNLIIPAAMNALGFLAMYNKDYKEAETYFRQSLQLTEKTGALLVKANILVNLANLKFYVNQIDSAEKFGNEALSLAEQIGSMQFQRQSWEILSNIYEKKGNYKDAFEAVKKFSTLNDSILSDESKQKVTKLQLQFEQERKEALAKIVLEKEKARKQRIQNLQYLAISVVIILIFVLLFIASIRHIHMSLKWIDYSSFVVVLLVFQFLETLLDPFISTYTEGYPLFFMSINIALATSIKPLHLGLEKRISRLSDKAKEKIKSGRSKKHNNIRSTG